MEDAKSIYREIREDLGLTRKQASKLLESISPERIERIENGKMRPHADEILKMSEVYKRPELCNRYCAGECPIGQKYIPELTVADLPMLVLDTADAVNRVKEVEEKLISIGVSGVHTEQEKREFVEIAKRLKRLSEDAQALLLWYEIQESRTNGGDL